MTITTYPIHVVPQHVGVHHRHSFQRHKGDESDYPRHHEANIFLWDKKPESKAKRIRFNWITSPANFESAIKQFGEGTGYKYLRGQAKRRESLIKLSKLFRCCTSCFPTVLDTTLFCSFLVGKKKENKSNLVDAEYQHHAEQNHRALRPNDCKVRNLHSFKHVQMSGNEKKKTIEKTVERVYHNKIGFFFKISNKNELRSYCPSLKIGFFTIWSYQ